jgi:hypothetical protein
MKKQVLWRVVAFGSTPGSVRRGRPNQPGRRKCGNPIPVHRREPYIPARTVHRHTHERYLLRISNSHDESVVVLTTKLESKAQEDTAKMVFHRYGRSYFLAELWGAGSETGRKGFPVPGRTPTTSGTSRDGDRSTANCPIDARVPCPFARIRYTSVRRVK